MLSPAVHGQQLKKKKSQMQVITSCLKGICLCSSHFPLKHTKNINNTHPFLTQPPPVLQFLSASGDLGTGEISLKFSNCNSKRGKTTTPCGHIQHYSFSRRLFKFLKLLCECPQIPWLSRHEPTSALYLYPFYIRGEVTCVGLRCHGLKVPSQKSLISLNSIC